MTEISDKGRAILGSAVADGHFRDDGASFRQTAVSLHKRGLLCRDPKEAGLWYPTHAGRALAGESANGEADAPIRDIYISQIDAERRLRVVDQARVDSLVASIAEIGLRTPITVTPVAGTNRFRLVAGAHRLAAASQRGDTSISCMVSVGDDLDAELWEIDENLCRAELTPADRALFVHRRKEIYLLKHPETAAGVAGGKARQNSATGKLSFADQTSRATGQDVRTIQRDATRGAKITDEALRRLRGTPADKGVFLDRLKTVDEEYQLLYVEAELKRIKDVEAESRKNRDIKMANKRAVRLGIIAAKAERGAATVGELPRAAFPVIYADPPWRKIAYSDETGQDKGNPYPSMSLDDIKALCAGDRSPATPDAILYLWVTSNRVPWGLSVMEAWGFSYTTLWTWNKVHQGTGREVRDVTEHVIIAKRGKFPGLLMGTQPLSLYTEPKTEHSVKPSFFAEEIERLHPDLPKLELFCRNPRPGWSAWGYEAAPAEYGEAAE